MALLRRPRVLVADEPTSALDTVSQADVITALRETTGPEQAALLFITHDVAIAHRLCDRAIVLCEGSVVADAPIDALLSTPQQHPYVAELIAAAWQAGEWAA